MLYGAVLLVITSYAQIDYSIFRDTSSLQASDSGKLHLEIDNFNYLRNYEYYGEIPLSYTLLGYQLIPQLKYQLNPYFSLKAGVMLRREFGRPGFFSADPVLTAKYQKKSLSLILGSLEGALNHRFIEPIYNVERIISNRLEQGLQILIHKKRFWFDWYLDWEKAIIRFSTYPEEFTTGISSRITLMENENLKIEFPVQALFAHRGGQIDTSHTSVMTLLNTALGASFTFKTNASFLDAIRTEHYFAHYRDMSGTKEQLYNSGNGWYSSLVFQSKWNIDLDLRYWKGNGFIGPRGGPLYTSVSEKHPAYGEKHRELFFASFIYDKQLFPNIFLDFRLEPYYDIRNGMFEYSYSLFLRFKKDFLLGRM